MTDFKSLTKEQFLEAANSVLHPFSIHMGQATKHFAVDKRQMVVDTFAKLAAKYPLGKRAGVTLVHMPNPNAAAATDSISYVMAYNGEMWSKDGRTLPEQKLVKGVLEHGGMLCMDSILIHEWGHLVMTSAQSHSNPKVRCLLKNMASDFFHSMMVDAFGMDWRPDKKAPTAYALANPNEYFAESFAMAEQGLGKDLVSVQHMMELQSLWLS